MSSQFVSTFENKLIYIFRINDDAHKELLKIGDATIHTDKSPDLLLPNCRELNAAAKQRINQYTSTAGTQYELLHTEIAVRTTSKGLKAFRDHDVHSVLKRSGINNHFFNTEKRQNEWFKTDLQTTINAIGAVKEGRSSLALTDITTGQNPIDFRPEQKEAIKCTISQFKNSNRMLWFAKMRFGKTLTALQVAKELKFNKTIIFTHRPVVSDGWFDDFGKIFYESDTEYVFGSKTKGMTIDELESSGKKYVYFVSIQDLRGSASVGGRYDKNQKEFGIDWDFVIIDEAHEGTKTELGQAVIEEIVKPNSQHTTKVLELSGTPFNLLTEFDEKDIYTWDYVKEQDAKRQWLLTHFGDSNPYDSLPELRIYTYSLDKLITGYEDYEDKAFNFKEFFRTWTGDVQIDRKHMPESCSVGDFIHEDDVKSFLNLITKTDDNSNYPFATEEYRDFFRHSLWMLPGVNAAKALSKLLKNSPVFGSGAFEIVNVAGNGDEEVDSRDALAAVRTAIGSNPEERYTITLSCGKLTTGVTIPEWTAVFMLSGSSSTSASSYLQTIFRVQSPANINGRTKEKCYVFDFAPDRTLKVLAEAVHMSTKVGSLGNSETSKMMGDFLNYCPVISVDGTSMTPYNVEGMMQQLKRVYTDRVVRNGFDDPHIYNEALLKLDNLALADFKDLRDIIGISKQTKRVNEVDVNAQGFTDEEYEEFEVARKKPKSELSEAEKARLLELKEKRKQRDTAMSILRGISIRIPLLVYGAPIAFEEEVTRDNFADIIDDLSWKEFMPNGVTKAKFKKFTKYYEPDVFISAGRQIRNIARSADALPIEERIKKLAGLFKTFKNPDKETVLTPWRVVNMHLSDCLGGYDFFGEDTVEVLEEPRFIDNGKVTSDTMANANAKVLEINSKSGLYPLYAAYSIFRAKCKLLDKDALDENTIKRLWNETIRDNIFVICKTPMAVSITKRTLLGYQAEQKANIRYFEDLINQLKNKPENFKRKVADGKNYWKANGDINMKFDAIVGNPPYQIMDGGNAASATPIYQCFVEQAVKMNPKYLSMIMPARWYAGGKGLDNFREFMLSQKQIPNLFDMPNSADCFPGVNIAGGICYFLWDKDYNGDCSIVNIKASQKVSSLTRPLGEYSMFVRDNIALDIIHKIQEKSKTMMNEIVQPYSCFCVRSYERGTELKTANDDVVLLSSNGKGYYPKAKIVDKENILSRYKVIITYAMSGGNKPSSSGTYQVVSSLKVLEPNEVCTETYLVINTFDNRTMAENMCAYASTKFFRFLMLQALSSIHITKDSFSFVPDQDFNKKWSDSELFAKYNLTEEEKTLIETKIKAMD